MPRKKLTEEEEIARVKAMYEYEDIRLLRELTRQAEVRLPVLYMRRRLYFRMTL